MSIGSFHIFTWLNLNEMFSLVNLEKKKLPPLSNVNMDCLTRNKVNKKTDRKICRSIDAGCGLTRDFRMGRAISEISLARA